MGIISRKRDQLKVNNDTFRNRNYRRHNFDPDLDLNPC